MRLKSFRVRNYRSINDSGDVTVSRITALLGRNESGKSNLLRALHSLNPIAGFEALKPIKDFPRRTEAGLADLGIPFHKTRPTRLFLKKMASEPEKVVPDQSLERFAALFTLINGRLDKLIDRNAKPFEG